MAANVVGVTVARFRPRRGGGHAVTAPALDATLLIEVRAALEAGATPAAALAVAQDGVLAEAAREVRLGRGLSAVASDVATGDVRADLLIRGLAVAERTGAGAAQAVEQVLRAAAEATAVARALEVRTTQARGTAVVLALLPLAVWTLLVVLDPATLAFYRTVPGLGTALAALALVLLARFVTRRIIARVARAPERVDPLRGPEPPRDPVRAIVAAFPVGVVLGLGAGPLFGVTGAAAAAGVGLRRRGPEPADLRGGGTPETAELLAIALAAGLPPVAAVAEIAALGPPAARSGLEDAARRLRAGWSLADAFDGTYLEAVGAVLDITTRWGAPADAALRRLADELRADRRAAGEAAAERTQLALLFPTTLLTLPAFVLAVVPPVLWTAFAG